LQAFDQVLEQQLRNSGAKRDSEGETKVVKQRDPRILVLEDEDSDGTGTQAKEQQHFARRS
jgi:hypothetical protein